MSAPWFVQPPNSSKVACRQCGARGYGLTNPTREQALPWQRRHMHEHEPCAVCGAPLAHQWAKGQHGRRHHAEGSGS